MAASAVPLLDKSKSLRDAVQGGTRLFIRGAVFWSIPALIIIALVDVEPPPVVSVVNLNEDHVKVTRVNGTQHLINMITDPNVMYQEYGIVSVPILFLSTKGDFNFIVQQVFFLTTAIFGGLTAIKAKYDGIPDFSILSRAFQIIGQVSIITSYAKIISATKPWQGTVSVLACVLLVSQHACSITGLAGLSNNLFLMAKLEDHRQRLWAKGLSISGLLVCLPLWCAMLAAFPYTVLPLIVLFASFVYLRKKQKNLSFMESAREVVQTASEDPGMLLSLMWFLSVGATLFATTVWLIMAIVQGHAWLMFAAYVVEFALPMAALFAVLLRYVGANQAFSTGAGFLQAFGVSMGLAYLLTMGVPSAILAYTSDAGVTAAAPAAFWGKKVLPYAQDTFTIPAASAKTSLGLWWSQVLSFFS